MWADRERLDDACAPVTVAVGDAHHLRVQHGGVIWPDGREVDGVAAFVEFGAPHAMTPFGMEVSESTHLHLSDRTMSYFNRVGSPAVQPSDDVSWPASAGLPFDVGIDAGDAIDVASIEAGVVVGAERRDRTAFVPGATVAVVVHCCVQDMVVETGWCPEPEELRCCRGAIGSISDGPNAPRSVTASADRSHIGQVNPLAIDREMTTPASELCQAGVVEGGASTIFANEAGFLDGHTVRPPYEVGGNAVSTVHPDAMFHHWSDDVDGDSSHDRVAVGVTSA